ncbi:MAG: Fatty acid metabolism regulator protein [candidate division WS6 bacterium OLB20]|uniref:Fatty acid metabolism regulator protein n=1 Tax=candidate division WS6 bacterium OLB20 TaxID=1617426 RepID=A0A136LWR2_9BACT|nr:MAG: Fatty acid metabolism regulator protein [candidate division WS6 bacterium OLB20]
MKRIPKRSNSRAKVDSIAAAAAHLFAEQGYHAVSTNHIADAAGVPIGSIYDYFKDKGDIALYLIAEIVHDCAGIHKKSA